jgi:aminoacyl tRNA synthase complex-interacting multifunctional protein 1
MSNLSIEKLPSPLKDLVLRGTPELGKSDKDKKEVTEWIDKVVKGDIVKPAGVKELDSQLVQRTYIVSNYLTAADVALYGALHPVLSQLQPPQYYSHPALTRYFDHIQSIPTVRTTADSLAPAFSVISFDIDNAPKLERKVDQAKKKEKKADKPADATVVGVPEKGKAPVAAEGKTDGKIQKEKKEKKKDAGATDGKKPGKTATVAEDAGEPVPSMIDLRVGHIIDIEKHPDADGLYIEQIDIGEETGPRTVVSGLVHYIPIEQMRDKYLVAVCNLKPANMRGVKSFAMVLCATSKEGKEGGIELIQPPANSKPGDRVYFEGSDYENATPLSQLNPKKKIFETIQPGFITLDSKEAAWVDPNSKSVHKIRTKDGVCVAPTLVGASLS